MEVFGDTSVPLCVCLCSGDMWPSKQPAALHTAAATVSLPAHLPLHAAGDHQPPPHHMPVRRGGAAALQGSLQPTAPSPGPAAGADPSRRARSTEPDRL